MPLFVAGLALLELLVVVTVAGILVLAAAPRLSAWAASRRLWAAATELRLAVAGVRGAAAAGRARAVIFEAGGAALRWSVVGDGDGDGVRSADVRSGTDARLLGPVSVPQRHRGVVGGLPPGASPLGSSPGRGGVAFGRGGSISCGRGGGCTSGTLYLRGAGGRGAALRVYGPTGRVRLFEWRPDGGGWRALR